jgi:hypothetical protein
MGEAITRHSLRPLRFSRAKLLATLGRERVAGSRRSVYLKVVQPECRQLKARSSSQPDAAGLAAIRTGRLGLLWAMAIVTILAERYGVGDV